MEKIHELASRINKYLIEIFSQIGVVLVDFKVEFGRLSDGSLVLSDEISTDTCRLWDAKTMECMDKDRFRRDLGRVAEAYNEILNRLSKL